MKWKILYAKLSGTTIHLPAQIISSMCVKSHIKGDDGCKYDIVTLGPIGVLPEYQNRGIGALLLDRSKVIAKELGYKAIVLCGDPDYYRRHGFVPAEQYLIRNSDNMWYKNAKTL